MSSIIICFNYYYFTYVCTYVVQFIRNCFRPLYFYALFLFLFLFWIIKLMTHHKILCTDLILGKSKLLNIENFTTILLFVYFFFMIDFYRSFGCFTILWLELPFTVCLRHIPGHTLFSGFYFILFFANFLFLLKYFHKIIFICRRIKFFL